MVGLLLEDVAEGEVGVRERGPNILETRETDQLRDGRLFAARTDGHVHALSLLDALPGGGLLRDHRADRTLRDLRCLGSQAQLVFGQGLGGLFDGQSIQARNRHHRGTRTAEDEAADEEGPDDRSGHGEQAHDPERGTPAGAGSPRTGVVVNRPARHTGTDRGHLPRRVAGDHRHGGGDRRPCDHPFHIRAELRRALVAVVGALRQRMHDDGVDLGGDTGIDRRGGRGHFTDVLIRDRHRGVPGERRLPGQQFVEQNAGGVEVAARVDDFTAGLLGGEVLRGTHHRTRRGHRLAGLVHGAGDSEVHHLHVTGASEHHVARLDVAVHDPVPVRVVECGQHARGDLKRTFREQAASTGQDLAQGHPVHVLHDDVGDDHVGVTLVGQHVFTRVVDRHDVGVVQGGRALGLAAEPGLEDRVLGEVGAQDLDGHAPPEPQVAALMHLGHATATDHLTDGVAVTEHALGTVVGHVVILSGACIIRCAGPPASRPWRWGRRARCR